MNVVEAKLSGPDGSATQRAYHTLRAMIVTGDLRPGEKLKIDALRQRLSTGASPIREALSLLTSDNLVERIDQRGFRTADVSAANFAEILNLRCTLEDMALRESIAHGDQAWEEAIVLAHHRMQRAKDARSGNFEELHKAFHMALLQNAGLPMLERYCAQLYDLNIRYRYLASGQSSYGKRSIEAEHLSIFNAALDRDAEAASAALLDHYRKTGRYLSGQMES